MTHNRFVSILISLVFLTVSLLSASAQSLTFCKTVNNDGKAIGAGEEFTLAKDGGKVTFLFQLPATSNVPISEVSYDVYILDKGKEVFSSTINQQVAPNQKWVSKEVTLYEPGVYRVYVYDANDRMFSRGSFTMKAVAE